LKQITGATAVRNDNDTAVINEPRAAGSFREEFYEVEEFAEAVGRKVETVWLWWRRGEGPPYSVLGRRRVIPKAAAREWLLQNQVTPPRAFKLCSTARKG
jgi:hypothetical protein